MYIIIKQKYTQLYAISIHKFLSNIFLFIFRIIDKIEDFLIYSRFNIIIILND